MNLAIISQLPKLIVFLKGQDETVYKQMWDYTFQLILHPQVQLSVFTRQEEANGGKGSSGQEGLLAGLYLLPLNR